MSGPLSAPRTRERAGCKKSLCSLIFEQQADSPAWQIRHNTPGIGAAVLVDAAHLADAEAAEAKIAAWCAAHHYGDRAAVLGLDHLVIVQS